MRIVFRIATAAAALAVMAAPASAQSYRWDFGLKGGWSWYTNSLDRDEVAHDGTVRFGDGPLGGIQITHWMRDRVGLRLNADYQNRPILGVEAPATGNRTLWEEMNLWTATGDVMIRFRAPNESWMGFETLPYLALGLGAKNHNPPASEYTLREAGETTGRSAAVFTARNSAGQHVGPVLGITDSWRFTGLVGLGMDLRISPNFAVRLEAFDRIFRPAMFLVTPSTNPNWQMADTRNVAQLTHELGLALGLNFITGLVPPPPVAVAPPPPPPPPPAAPPPPPPPAEDEIMICVIDPSAPGGIRMQSAIFRHQQGDTVVVVDGQRVPLAQRVPTVPVARGADWYVRGEPLTIGVGAQQFEFVTYQTPVQIQPAELTYLGRVNGMPVYGDRDQVQRIAAQIQQAHQAVATHDLPTILAQNREIRDVVADLQVLYVPLQPVGCVFQGMLRTEDVRKGK